MENKIDTDCLKKLNLFINIFINKLPVKYADDTILSTFFPRESSKDEKETSFEESESSDNESEVITNTSEAEPSNDETKKTKSKKQNGNLKETKKTKLDHSKIKVKAESKQKAVKQTEIPISSPLNPKLEKLSNKVLKPKKESKPSIETSPISKNDPEPLIETSPIAQNESRPSIETFKKPKAKNANSSLKKATNNKLANSDNSTKKDAANDEPITFFEEIEAPKVIDKSDERVNSESQQPDESDLKDRIKNILTVFKTRRSSTNPKKLARKRKKAESSANDQKPSKKQKIEKIVEKNEKIVNMVEKNEKIEEKKAIATENAEQPTKESGLRFNRFEFSEETFTSTKKNKYKGKTPEQILALTLKEKEKLEELKKTDPEKAKALQEKQMWSKAFERTRGVIVKDDINLLKKSVKKMKSKKTRSEKKWNSINEHIEDKKNEKQKKREKNIQKRKDDNLKRKIKKRK